ncbi:MAG: D-alanine--D-alanine ligase [Bacteroidales bacterium]|nr:D-alanine--D-alanine ligase [Bacteroidales bacterium]MDZ4203383.1 D-alanine--D-alanine ligase [Bacteroidales bacterium]
MKKKIALITGGNSGELDISLKSAGIILKHIDRKNYEVYSIVITGNEWWFYSDSGTKYLIDKNDFSLTTDGNKITFDCVFIAIHGTPGEDGKLQGYFDLMNIPYTSCDLFTSALTFNKYFAGLAVNNLGVPVAKSVFLALGDTVDTQKILETTGLPCFVKPNKGGSSVGVVKVDSQDQLTSAIANAFQHDDEVLIQQYIKGREITCGLISYKGEVIVFPLCEIVSKKEFFDYEAKYTPGMADEILPAPIGKELDSRCRELSVYLYKSLNCKGIVRFDYMLNQDKFYFLEVNTIPGLTENSIVPRQARAMGISMTELFTMAIEDAVQWHDKRRYLSQPGNRSKNRISG